MTIAAKIRIPIARRFQLFRSRGLPLVLFLVCVAGSLALWKRHGRSPNTVGSVDAVRVDVISTGAGVLTTPPKGDWQTFDFVDAGMVVATIDASHAQARLTTLAVDREALKDEIGATRERLAFDKVSLLQEDEREAVRLSWQAETLRLQVMDRAAQIAVDRIELQRLDLEVQSTELLVGASAASRIQYDRARLERERTQARICAAETALAEATAQRAVAVARLDQRSNLIPVEVAKLLQPLRTAVTAQEARMREIEIEVTQLAIGAPVSGTIMAIHRRPGQAVVPGEPIVTIATHTARHVTVYVRESQGVTPSVGMRAAATSRNKQTKFETIVNEVGPQVELVPIRHRTDPTRPEWGIPVRCAIPESITLRPGELIDITLK